MSEAPKRIGICPIHKTWHRGPHETDWNYIRADLVEAKLAKAVEAMNNLRQAIRESGVKRTGCMYPAVLSFDAILAELKGDKL